MIGSVYAYVLIILIPLFFSIKDGALVECDLIHLVKVNLKIFSMIMMITLKLFEIFSSGTQSK